MSGPFREDMARGRGRFGVVQFTERVDQQYVEYVARPAGCGWTSACMKLLGNLDGEAQTPYRRSYGDSEFRETLHSGGNQIDAGLAGRSEIDFNRLPCSSPVLDNDLDTDCVSSFHVASLSFEPEREPSGAGVPDQGPAPAPRGPVSFPAARAAWMAISFGRQLVVIGLRL